MKSHFSFYINPFSFVMLKSVSQNYPNCIQYAFHSRSSPVGSMDIHWLRKLSLGGWAPLSDYSNHKNYQLCSPSIWQIQREVMGCEVDISICVGGFSVYLCGGFLSITYHKNIKKGEIDFWLLLPGELDGCMDVGCWDVAGIYLGFLCRGATTWKYHQHSGSIP